MGSVASTLMRQVLKRLPKQKSYAEATQEVGNRGVSKRLDDPELPENIDEFDPDAAVPGTPDDGVPHAPDEGTAPQPDQQTGVPEPGNAPPPNQNMNVGEPFTKEEHQRVLDAVDTEVGDDPISNMNYRRLDTEEDISGFLEEFAKIKEEKGEGGLKRTSFAETEGESLEADWTVIRQKWRDGIPLEKGELRKVRKVEASLFSAFQKEARALREKIDNGEVTDQMEFDYRILETKLAAVSQFVHNEKRRLGQNLAVLRDRVSDNQHISNLQRDRYLSSVGMQESLATRLDRTLLQNTPEEMRKVLLGTKRQRIQRFVGNTWYNAVLSLFAPIKAVLGGAVISKVIYPIEAGFASMASKAFRVFGEDAASQPAINRSVVGGEFIIELSGAIQGMKDAAIPILKHLKDPSYDIGAAKYERHVNAYDTLHGRLGSKADETYNWKENPEKLGLDIVTQLADAVTQNGSMRAMKMVDSVVRSVAFQQRTKSMAYRVAVNEGLEGDALVKRMGDILDEMPDDMYEEGRLAGDVATLTQQLWSSFKKIDDTIQGVPGLRFFAAFTRTMFAGAQTAIERTPGVAFLSDEVRKAWNKGGASRHMVVGKQMTGAFLMGLGAFEAASGRYQSGMLITDQERRSKFASKWRPNSFVTADGNYWSAQFTSPAFEMMTFGAALYELSEYMNAGISPEDPRFKDWGEVITELAGSSIWLFVDITLNKSVGQGLADTMEALQDPRSHAKQKVVRTASPFLMPAGGKIARRLFDPVKRRVPRGTTFQEYLGQVQNQLPGASDNLVPAYGYFGERSPQYSLMDVFSYSPNDPNALLFNELYLNGVTTFMPSETMSVGPSGASAMVSLDREILPEHFSEEMHKEKPESKKRGYAYSRFVQIRGQIYKDGLEELFNSDEYQNDDIPYGEKTGAGQTITAVGSEEPVNTKGDLISQWYSLMNSNARIAFYEEMAEDMIDGEGFIIAKRMSEKPTENKFMPAGIPKAVKKSKEAEAEEGQRYKEQYDQMKRENEVKFK